MNNALKDVLEAIDKAKGSDTVVLVALVITT